MNPGMIAAVLTLGALAIASTIFARRAWLTSASLERQLMDTRAQRAEQHREDLGRAQVTAERLEAQMGRLRDETTWRLDLNQGLTQSLNQSLKHSSANIDGLSERLSEVSGALNELHSKVAVEMSGRIETIFDAVEILTRKPLQPDEIWLDVGAHLGEKTFPAAADNPRIRVYAFEPNLQVASKMMGRLSNYVVLPMAVAERDGSASFYLNQYTAASSLRPFDPAGLEQWVGGEELRSFTTMTVPTVRLDTFLDRAGIARVEYLKIDTQGGDLEVVRSAGARLGDIRRIVLEVQITPLPLYRDSGGKEEVTSFLSQAGFELVSSEKQSYDQEENLTFIRRADAP